MFGELSGKMPSQNRFPVYDQRLRVIVAGIKAKPDSELTIAWKKDLDSHSLDDLVNRIADMTLTQTKKVLSSDEPPNTSEMHQLRPVNGSSKPGTYFGLTEDSTASNNDSTSKSSNSIPTLSTTKPKVSRSHKVVDSSTEDEASESEQTSHSLSSKSTQLRSKATTQAPKRAKKKSPARKVVESSSDDEDGGSEQSSDDDDDDDVKTNFQMPSVSTIWTASNSTGSNSSAFGYNGSATRVGCGLFSRTNQHLDEEYRKTYLEKKPNYYHYLPQKNGDRSETFFVLAETEWPSEKAEDITETRFLLVLAEQVYTIWLRTYTSKAAAGPQKDLAALCPWPGKRFSWSGVNQSSPVRNEIARAAKDAQGLTPAEQNKRTADRARQKKENWTPEELGEAQDKRVNYHQLVALPVRKFKVKAKNASMPKSKVDAAVKEFQKAIRLAKKSGGIDQVDSEKYLKVRK